MENKSFKTILIMFILAVIGLPLLIGLVGIINPLTGTTSVNNEIINISSARNGTNTNESIIFEVQYNLETTGNSPISNFVLGNSTDDATITTDYLVDLTNGNFTLVNSSFWRNSDNISYVDYDYYAREYLDSSSTRVMINLLIGFFALVILMGIVMKLMGIFGAEVEE